MSTRPEHDARTDHESPLTRFDVELSDEDDVEHAPNADACGALGCRTTENLRYAEHPRYGRRVVCPDHAEEITEGDG